MRRLQSRQGVAISRSQVDDIAGAENRGFPGHGELKLAREQLDNDGLGARVLGEKLARVEGKQDESQHVVVYHHAARRCLANDRQILQKPV